MNKNKMISKLKKIKPHYEKEGFIIKGIIGSYARDEATKDSDLDIVYELNLNKFLKKYDGFKSFSKIKEIKEELERYFNLKIDLCAYNQQNQIFKQNLKSLIYV